MKQDFEKKEINKRKEHKTELILWQLARLQRRNEEWYLRDIDLYTGQPRILFFIQRHGGCTISAIAKKMGVTPASMVKTINRLEASGHVIKKQDEEDKRVQRVYIAEKGEEIAKQIEDIYAQTYEDALEGFTEEEKEEVTEYLERIRVNLKNLRKKRKGEHSKHRNEREEGHEGGHKEGKKHKEHGRRRPGGRKHVDEHSERRHREDENYKEEYKDIE